MIEGGQSRRGWLCFREVFVGIKASRMLAVYRYTAVNLGIRFVCIDILIVNRSIASRILNIAYFERAAQLAIASLICHK
jgi:hypothetical protein